MVSRNNKWQRICTKVISRGAAAAMLQNCRATSLHYWPGSTAAAGWIEPSKAMWGGGCLKPWWSNPNPSVPRRQDWETMEIIQELKSSRSFPCWGLDLLGTTFLLLIYPFWNGNVFYGCPTTLFLQVCNVLILYACNWRVICCRMKHALNFNLVWFCHEWTLPST